MAPTLRRLSLALHHPTMFPLLEIAMIPPIQPAQQLTLVQPRFVTALTMIVMGIPTSKMQLAASLITKISITMVMERQHQYVLVNRKGILPLPNLGIVLTMVLMRILRIRMPFGLPQPHLVETMAPSISIVMGVKPSGTPI